MTADRATDCRYLLGTALLACLVMGGGTVRGLAVDQCLQVLLIAVATYTIVRLWKRPAPGVGWAMFALVLCTGSAQIVPLPAGLFYGLRPDVYLPSLASGDAGYSFATASLAASRTISSLSTALCGLYLFIALAKLPSKDLTGVIPFFLAGVIVNLVVVFLSISGGNDYEIQGIFGYEFGEGLFANDNHLSTLLCACIPLALYIGYARKKLYLSAVLMVFILISLLAVGSRAGILIGLAVLVMSVLLLAWRTRVGGILALGLLAAVTIYGYGAFVRIDGGEAEATLQRRDFMLTTLRGIGDHWRLGTGYGSFDLVYPHYERPQDVYAAYVNHAHNDFLEIVLEGGVAGGLVVLAYLVLVLARFAAIGDAPLQRLSFLSLCVVLVHSTVDYPLRTTAIAAAFAFFNALFFLNSGTARPAPVPSAGGRDESG